MRLFPSVLCRLKPHFNLSDTVKLTWASSLHIIFILSLHNLLTEMVLDKATETEIILERSKFSNFGFLSETYKKNCLRDEID